MMTDYEILSLLIQLTILVLAEMRYHDNDGNDDNQPPMTR